MNQKLFCLNCSKVGHILKQCPDPIASYGIICFNYDNKLKINSNLIEKFLYNKFIEIPEYNLSNLNNIKYIPQFYKSIKILMIRRRNSLNYVDFIRGKYSLDKESIQKIFNYISKFELNDIKNKSFKDLWEELWINNAWKKVFHNEYIDAHNKFLQLKKLNFFNLLDNIENYPWSEPEWEIPKGRKNVSESTINCAIREFSEETGIKDINVLERINPISENYQGTNLVNYKSVYYLATMNEHLELEKFNNMEVSIVKWLTIDEALEKIRPYCEEKIKLIHQTYFFLINLYLSISEQGKVELINI